MGRDDAVNVRIKVKQITPPIYKGTYPQIFMPKNLSILDKLSAFSDVFLNCNNIMLARFQQTLMQTLERLNHS